MAKHDAMAVSNNAITIQDTLPRALPSTLAVFPTGDNHWPFVELNEAATAQAITLNPTTWSIVQEKLRQRDIIFLIGLPIYFLEGFLLNPVLNEAFAFEQSLLTAGGFNSLLQ